MNLLREMVIFFFAILNSFSHKNQTWEFSLLVLHFNTKKKTLETREQNLHLVSYNDRDGMLIISNWQNGFFHWKRRTFYALLIRLLLYTAWVPYCVRVQVFSETRSCSYYIKLSLSSSTWRWSCPCRLHEAVSVYAKQSLLSMLSTRSCLCRLHVTVSAVYMKLSLPPTWSCCCRLY